LVTGWAGGLIKHRATAAVDAKISGVDAESMKMRVAPPQGNLEGLVKIGDGAVAANQKPAPDHGADLPQDYFELIHKGFN
jgi:hypothetical protein